MSDRPASETETLVECQDLKVHFPVSGRLVLRAVDGVSLRVQAKEIVGLVGESGSGKTTLGQTLTRLLKPSAGSIRFEGRDITALKAADLKALRRRMQLVFQDPYASLHPRMRVAEILAEPFRIHRLGDRDSIEAAVAELLDQVGLDRRLGSRFPHELSGGQRQRVGIGRALALDPRFIVADEPVSALDVSVQAQILNLLRRLQRERELALLFISHDLSVVRYLCDRVLVMYLGQIVEQAPTKTLFAAPAHPYSMALMSAKGGGAGTGRQRIILSGDLPSPIKPPTGCRFQSRCWLRAKLGNPSDCERESPPLAAVGQDHLARCHFAKDLASTKGLAGLERRQRKSASETRLRQPALAG